MQELPDWAEPNVQPRNNQGPPAGCQKTCKDGCPPCNPDNPGNTPDPVPVEGTGLQLVLLIAGIAFAASKLVNN